MALESAGLFRTGGLMKEKVSTNYEVKLNLSVPYS
jgi:hypothetical protein